MNIAAVALAALFLDPAGVSRPGAAIPDHYPPFDPDPAYDVAHYDIQIELSPAEKRFSGETRVTGVARHAGLAEITLDYEGPPISSVSAPGAGTLDYRWQDGKLTVTLPAQLATGDTFAVEVAYAGAPPEPGVGVNFPPDFKAADSPAVFTFSEPEMARSWYPCHDVPDDKATVDLRAVVPGNFVAGSNGRLVEERLLDDGRRLFHWQETTPIATYLISVAAAPYVILRDDRLPGIPIVNYVYRPDSAAAESAFAHIPEMIEYFSTLFGPYPFNKYGHTEAYFGGGMEHQSLTLIGDFTVRLSGDYYQPLFAHELAHQWWGDAVTPRDWRHVWLNEGFASYGDALWAEHLGGPAALAARMNVLGGIVRLAVIDRGLEVPVLDPPGDHLFSFATYNKGAWILHMLRHIVGDDTFFRILRDYQAAHRYGNAVTEDFVAASEQVYGGDLHWFFDPWLVSPRLPRYRLDWSALAAADGRQQVQVRVSQWQPDTFFPMPVDFAFITPSGETRRTVFIDRSPQAFTVLLDEAPVDTGVVLDPDGWILKTVDRAPVEVADSAPSQLEKLSLVSAGVGAGPFRLRADLSAGSPVPLRLQVIDVRGRRIAEPFDGMAATGPNELAWDGRTAGGERAPSGVYWVRVMLPGQVRALRLILVR